MCLLHWILKLRVKLKRRQRFLYSQTEKTKSKSQLASWHVNTQYILVSPTPCNMLMTPAKQQLTTANPRGSIPTLLQCRRQESLQKQPRRIRQLFFWLDNAPEEEQEFVVGFEIGNFIQPDVEPPSNGTGRVLPLRQLSTLGPWNLLSSADKTKYGFCAELDSVIRVKPTTERPFLPGKFIASVGSEQDSWNGSIGHFGVGKMTRIDIGCSNCEGALTLMSPTRLT